MVHAVYVDKGGHILHGVHIVHAVHVDHVVHIVHDVHMLFTFSECKTCRL